MKKGLKIRRKGGFKPMSVIMKMTKESILYRIKEKLKTYSKKRLAVFYYNLLKNDLPQLRTIKRKALPKRKTKRKFSRKQLAAQRLFAKRARAGTLRKGLTAFQKSERKAFQQAARKRKRERYFIGAGGMTGG